MKAWKHYVSKQSSGLKVKVINTTTEEISNYQDPKYQWSMDPWDDDMGEIRLVMEKRILNKALEDRAKSKGFYDGASLGLYHEDNW